MSTITATFIYIFTPSKKIREQKWKNFAQGASIRVHVYIEYIEYNISISVAPDCYKAFLLVSASFIFSTVWQHCFVAMTLFALSHVCVCVCLSIPLQKCKCMRGPVSEKFSANFCPKIKQHWQEIVLASYAQLLPTCHCCPGIGRNIRSTCVRWSIRGDGSKCAVPVCVCVCACGCAKPLAGRSQREKFEGCR